MLLLTRYASSPRYTLCSRTHSTYSTKRRLPTTNFHFSEAFGCPTKAQTSSLSVHSIPLQPRLLCRPPFSVFGCQVAPSPTPDNVPAGQLIIRTRTLNDFLPTSCIKRYKSLCPYSFSHPIPEHTHTPHSRTPSQCFCTQHFFVPIYQDARV